MRTRPHIMNTWCLAWAGSQCSDIMLHNSIFVLQDCSVLLFVPFKYQQPVTNSCTHMEVFFQWRRLTQWEDVLQTSCKALKYWCRGKLSSWKCFQGTASAFVSLFVPQWRSLTRGYSLITAERLLLQPDTSWRPSRCHMYSKATKGTNSFFSSDSHGGGEVGEWICIKTTSRLAEINLLPCLCKKNKKTKPFLRPKHRMVQQKTTAVVIVARHLPYVCICMCVFARVEHLSCFHPCLHYFKGISCVYDWFTGVYNHWLNVDLLLRKTAKFQ